MPLVLDTNIVRHLGEGEIDSTGFLLLRAEGISIHLPEAGSIELLLQLRQGRFPWDKWLRARGILRKILSSIEPVTLGHDFAGRRHPYATPHEPQLAANSADYKRFVRKVWKSIDSAKTPIDIGARIRPGYAGFRFDVENLAAKLNRTKGSWVEEFNRIRTDVTGSFPGHGDAPEEQFDELVGRLAGSIDDRAREYTPPASIRWDAMIRVSALYATRRLKDRGAYNPEKNANDSIDYDLPRYLAVPAAVCTRDRRLISALRDARCWQAEWAIRPEDLVRGDIRRRLATLSWPT